MSIPKFSFGLLISLLLLFTTLSAQQKQSESVVPIAVDLIAGPMLGHVDMREASIWLQVAASASVELRYWKKDEPSNVSKQKLMATATDFHILTFHLTLLDYGSEYEYDIYINGQKKTVQTPQRFRTLLNWQFRDKQPDFKFAIGSCTYVNDEPYDRKGRSYGGEYNIFNQIVTKEPDFMLWLGDNIYLRPPDWNDYSGIVYRYMHMRQLPELQRLLTSMPHYAIWDDHDFGPNNSDRSYIHKDAALDAFKLFWPNPSYGLGDRAGITTQFSHSDVDFFLLDNRYFRSPNDLQKGEKTILGQKQLDWIIDALVSSGATFKMVAIGGQVLNTAEAYETYANIAPKERAYLLKRIEEENIQGVVFLNGDRHNSEVSRLDFANGNWVLDVTSSPLTSGAHFHPEEPNELRIPDSYIGVRNFAVLAVSGLAEARKLSITYVDGIGKELWNYTIDAPSSK